MKSVKGTEGQARREELKRKNESNALRNSRMKRINV